MPDHATTPPQAHGLPPYRLVLDPRVVGGQHLDKANIATDLVPRVEEHLQASTQVRIVGYDGANFSPAYAGEWTKAIAKWMTRGVHIEYFIQKPSQQTIQILKDLLKQHEGNFRVYMPGSPEDYTPIQLQTLARWEREHFVIFDEPDQLWLERNHPPGETFAEDCYYFGPGEAQGTADFPMLKRQFDKIKASSLEVHA